MELLTSALKKSVLERGRLLVAVSGGKDSVSLLHALVNLSRHEPLQIAVAHVDHGIRSDSGSDAQFVSSLAESFGVPLFLHRTSPPDKENVESWGRKVRYQFFSELLRDGHANSILTAHTRDDQRELFLMRLFSNKPFAPMLEFDPRRDLLRPLLHVSRKTIEEYVLNHNLAWVEDRSNSDSRYLRNRTRNDVIPFLKAQYGEELLSTIDDQIEAVSEVETLIEGEIDEALVPLVVHEFGSKGWKVALETVLKNEARSVMRWRLADRVFFNQFNYRLGRRSASRLVQFFTSDMLQCQLPHNVTARRSGGGVIFLPTV